MKKDTGAESTSVEVKLRQAEEDVKYYQELLESANAVDERMRLLEEQRFLNLPNS